jgi:hypothetical protein
MIGELEVLSDRDGAIVFGWVAQDVLYAQMIEHLQAALGMRYATRLEQHLVSRSSAKLYIDCSGLETYEFPARAAIGRVLLTHRKRVASVSVLVRSRVVELGMHALGTTLGGLMAISNVRADFVATLDRAAPLARRYVQNPRAWVPAVTSVIP